MKTMILAVSAALALSTVAHAQTTVVAPDETDRTTTVAPSTGTVVEERATVVEERNPYAPRYELNTQARERTPGVGDGTSSSRNANQN